MFKPWLQLFRAPNLPTAVGDAVAGAAAVALVVYGNGERPLPARVGATAFAAGVAELLLYMGICMVGLSGNGSRAEEADRADRLKERAPRLGPWLMGLFRGLSVVAGAFAAARAVPAADDPLHDGCSGTWVALVCFVPAMALGWTLYAAAVARLAAGGGRAAGGLGARRFAPAFCALVPVWFEVPPLFRIDEVLRASDVCPGAFLPLAGCAAAAAAWCAAVFPLGRPHGPAERGRAAGRASVGLLWMQTGFLCAWGHGGGPVPTFVALAAVCWAVHFAQTCRRKRRKPCGRRPHSATSPPTPPAPRGETERSGPQK